MKQYKIAIVDDHQVILDGLNTMLTGEEQISICKTISSTEALITILQAIHFDLLLLDVEVNGVNTFSLIPHIKANFPQAKIIIFTSYDRLAFRKKAARLGVDAYLVKAANKEQILTSIYKVLHIETAIPNRSKNLLQKKLSDRELEILVLVAKGNTSQKIAEQLFISKHTVQWHRKNILTKLQLSSMGEMIKFAIEQKLV